MNTTDKRCEWCRGFIAMKDSDFCHVCAPAAHLAHVGTGQTEKPSEEEQAYLDDLLAEDPNKD